MNNNNNRSIFSSKTIKSSVLKTATIFTFLISAPWAIAQTHPIENIKTEYSTQYSKEEYAAALQNLKTPERAKDPDAQLLLANMYLQGQGVKKNVPQALELYDAAAAQNQSEAQLTLGAMYMVGQNVKKDNALALKWFAVRIAQKDKDAEFMLSMLLPGMTKAEKEQGYSLARDYLKANSIKVQPNLASFKQNENFTQNLK